MAAGDELFFPVQDFHKVVVFRILHILFGCAVILFTNIMQIALEYHLNRFRFNIYQSWFYFAFFILYIFEIEW